MSFVVGQPMTAVIFACFLKRKDRNSQQRRELGIAWKLSCRWLRTHPNAQKPTRPTFPTNKFVSLWFTSIFTDVFQVVPLGDNPLKILVGMPLFCWDFSWGSASLWTSLAVSTCNEGIKQMVCGCGTFGHRNTCVSWPFFILFLTFGLDLFEITAGFLLEFSRLNVYVMLRWMSVSSGRPEEDRGLRLESHSL